MSSRFMVIVLMGALLSACVGPIRSMRDHTYQVWDEERSPPPQLPAPAGFKITPAQAYDIATAGRPQKWGLYVYADRSHYYVVEPAPMLTTTSAYARKYGTRVDGTTGERLRPHEQPPQNDK